MYYHYFCKKLKFLLLTGVLTFLTIATLLAQGVTFGAKGGVNLNKFRSQDSLQSFTLAPGIQAGLVLNVASSAMFSLQPELNFALIRSSSAASTANAEDALVAESSLNFWYAEVPIMFKFTTGYKYRFFANAGPVMGFLIGGKHEGTYNVGARIERFRYDELAFLKGHNIQLGIGLGLLVDNLIFEARYQHGLTEISNPEFLSLKSQTVSLSAGYLLYF